MKSGKLLGENDPELSKTFNDLHFGTQKQQVLVKTVLLSQIHIDHEWNTRSQLDDSDGETSKGLEGLIESIELHGQETPVIVALTNDNKTPYILRAGFRRCVAIQKIAEKHKQENPTVIAEIKIFQSEADALAQNIRENVSRSSLPVQDLAFGIRRLVALNPDWSVKRIAQSLGVHDSYAYNLHNLTVKLDEKILKHWRSSPISLSVSKMMGLTQYPRDEQWEKYKELLQDKTEKKGAKIFWFSSLLVSARKTGKMLGVLCKKNVIMVNDVERLFTDEIETILSVPPRITNRQMREVCERARESFMEELEK